MLGPELLCKNGYDSVSAQPPPSPGTHNLSWSPPEDCVRSDAHGGSVSPEGTSWDVSEPVMALTEQQKQGPDGVGLPALNSDLYQWE